MASKEHCWRIEKRVLLKGWQRADSIVGTFEEVINRANEILTEDDGIMQVRFARFQDSIVCGCYIPQWMEDA